MNTTLILIIIIALIILLPYLVYRRKGPTGFDGIKWGTPSQKVPGLEIHHQEDATTFYTKTPSVRDFGGAYLYELTYIFHQKYGFYGIRMEVQSEPNYQKVKKELTKLFGNPDDDARYEPRWRDSKAVATLDYNMAQDTAIGTIASRAIMEKIGPEYSINVSHHVC